MTGVLTKRGNLSTERYAQRKDNMKTQGECDRLQAKENASEQSLLSQPSEGNNPAVTLILDLQGPEL